MNNPVYKTELHIQNRHYTSIIQPATPFYTEVYCYMMSLAKRHS